MSQRVPAPDRYREIQQVLIDKGYMQGAPSGVWGSDSAEALKRFQRDQNLQANGKLDSLSLMALGLGPKRDSNGISGAPHTAVPGTSVPDVEKDKQ